MAKAKAALRYTHRTPTAEWVGKRVRYIHDGECGKLLELNKGIAVYKTGGNYSTTDIRNLEMVVSGPRPEAVSRLMLKLEFYGKHGGTMIENRSQRGVYAIDIAGETVVFAVNVIAWGKSKKITVKNGCLALAKPTRSKRAR